MWLKQLGTDYFSFPQSVSSGSRRGCSRATTWDRDEKGGISRMSVAPCLSLSLSLSCFNLLFLHFISLFLHAWSMDGGMEEGRSVFMLHSRLSLPFVRRQQEREVELELRRRESSSLSILTWTHQLVPSFPALFPLLKNLVFFSCGFKGKNKSNSAGVEVLREGERPCLPFKHVNCPNAPPGQGPNIYSLLWFLRHSQNFKLLCHSETETGTYFKLTWKFLK